MKKGHLFLSENGLDLTKCSYENQLIVIYSLI